MNFSQEQIEAIQGKHGTQNQFVFSVMLKFFEEYGRFPQQKDPDLKKIIPSVSKILHLQINEESKWDNRSAERFKKEIRQHFGFRSPTLQDKAAFISYCQTYIFPYAPRPEQALEQAYGYFREQKLEPYSNKQLERFLNEAHHQFEDMLFSAITQSLSENTKKQLDHLLKCRDNEDSIIDEDLPLKAVRNAPDLPSNFKPINIVELKDQRVELKFDSIVWFVQKHQHLNQLQLPINLESKGCSRMLLIRYYERILTERLSSIARYHPEKRYACLAIFCYICHQLSSDILVDLLLKLLKRISTKAENCVDTDLRLDSKRVSGKLGTLLVLAQKSIEYPNGIIGNVIYPVISQDRLTAIINDLGEDEGWYQILVKTKALSLYVHNNRKLVWLLIEALEFEAKPRVQATLKALNFLSKLRLIEKTKRGKAIKKRLYNPKTLNPLVPKLWLPLVMIPSDHEHKVEINWYSLEFALFEVIQTELTVKNIWVPQAYRYRNPEQDLPTDFDENENFYFKILNLPKDPKVFISSLKTRLKTQLKEFDTSIVDNPKVHIKKRKKKGAIRLTPFEPRQEPENLILLKTEIAQTWPNLQLIDVLKETAYRIGFLDIFTSVGSRESIPKDKLNKRLLLSLHGMGTNTGIKNVSSLNEIGERYDDLRYVKKRYINCQNVKLAIQKVINELLSIRDPRIWGFGTTIGASDSKKLNVWDQNLIAEWHARYGGRGIMIYWHVKEGLCIHSMLKTCTSSEVSSMIHGVLHHDTLMYFDKISVDTHGQSTIGFAFSELFGFELLPRLKDLHKQKLYCASKNQKTEYLNLTDALASDAIVWSKIESNYREMVKHAVAIKIKSVEPAVMLRRLSSNNKLNPVYQALLEIGKAVRTIFLCRYLSSEELRIEIQEALNLVERVNSLMGFIFYGRLGEVSTNRAHDQELALLCLHLLQVCMCYITTILIQTILSDPKWVTILTKEDMRALSPLFHGHINPYGLLFLDMGARISIEKHQFKGKLYA